MESNFDVASLAHYLGKATKTAKGYRCLCPAHDDRNPSLSLSRGSEGQLLAYCHAGCSFEHIVDALPYQVKQIKILPLCYTNRTKNTKPYINTHLPASNSYTKDTKLQPFYQLWETSKPSQGTVMEAYLQTRGYRGAIPSTLRCLANAFHTPTRTSWPCMVAAIRRWPHDIIGIHRTYLKTDGSGKAGVCPNKMMLGRAKGGGVYLQPVNETLILAEGIETALSIALTFPSVGVWAVLSASHMASLFLPPLPLAQNLIIAADHDSSGLQAAYQAAHRWHGEGRYIKIALPPQGQDFNDVLRGV